MDKIFLTGRDLKLSDLGKVLNGNVIKLILTTRVRRQVLKSRLVIEKALASSATGRPIYGVNTGFGKLANVKISNDEIGLLQKNVIRSHATAIGPILPIPETKLVMLFRINTLVKGHSGVTLKLVNTLINMFNKGVYPLIPQKGSVGASGDLAPLSHLALGVIGEGPVIYKNKKMSARQAMRKAGLKPHELTAKEGLALINGTQVMTAILASALLQAEHLCKMADIAGAVSLEGLKGTLTPFHPQIQVVRSHPGQSIVARNFRQILQSSKILASHKDCPRVQDSYSLRCIPQVHGAVRDGINYIKQVLEREINSATDNPLVFPETNQILSGGNFHGHPIAVVADWLGILLAGLTNISERRIEYLSNADLSGLPPFLVKKSGLNSGLMVAQVMAASLASENKIWAHPASVDSIPTSANKEDFVSMGTTAARKCRMIIENLEYVLAVELLCATQALEFNKDLKPGKGVAAAYQIIRKKVKPINNDRVLKNDIENLRNMVADRTIGQAVEKIIGRLK